MRNMVTVILLLTIPSIASAQKHRQYIRHGNKEYLKNNFEQSEIEYRRALDENPESEKATFNLGDALYRKGNFEEAEKEFDKYSAINKERIEQAAAHFNRGNSLLKAGAFEKSIEAYKASLINDPTNHQAKYNLAYAQDQLNQKKNQDQQQNQDQDQEKRDNKEQQDKENQQQDNKGDSEDDQKKSDQQKENNEDQNQDKKSEEKQSERPSEAKMTREDAERLLQALANDEQEVQEKVKKEKAAAARVKTLKNW